MKPLPFLLAGLIALAISACATPESAPTQIAPPPPTTPPPSDTPSPTETPAPTETPPPPTLTSTPTPVPQPLLLRRKCGRDYTVNAGEPIELFYGGWGVIGSDLAEEWTTALTIGLTIDGLSIDGQQQPPSPGLPYDCEPDIHGAYWLFDRTVIPGLAPGTYQVSVTIYASEALSDGSIIYGPGQIAQQTFRITAK